ncbi:MAG: metallophosphoesterase [Clostridia bacterium]|nr:metallophosphoesterase [Clostridia bacterium]
MSDKLSLYIMTDTHFLSPKMWEEGGSITNREKGDQIAIKSTPFILRSFFKKIIEDNETEYVLITGDLINNGDKQSHLDFIEELKALTAVGKKVLVTCATHDYAGLGDDENIFHAVYYTKDGCEKAERVYKTELPELYFDYGHKYADSVDNESGSYSVPLPNGLRLIAIYDNGNGRSHCGLFDEGFVWLENEIKKANSNNETVFLAVHHPVIPPWPVYSDVVNFEMFGGYERLRKIMCENGVKVIFTGHTHVQGIKKYTDNAGRSFYDITTSALPSAAGKMRKVVFDKENNTCSVESIGIDTIEGFDTKGLSARDYIYSLNFSGLLEKSLPLIKTDWEEFVENASHVVNVDILKKHPHISKTVLKHFSKMKMTLPAMFAKKVGGITKDEMTKLKNTLVKDTAFGVLSHVFSGNAPFTPDTPEYKVITGCIIRAGKWLKCFNVDIDKLVPGEETALETVKHFLYNTRTGDDNSIIIDLEK